MIDLILLAAGASRRFGGPKLQTEFHGKPLYQYAFEAASQAAQAIPQLEVMVVTRAGMLEEAIESFGFQRVLVPPEHPLSTSVTAGSQAGREGASRCFLVCDQPGVTGEMLIGFLKGYQDSGLPLGRVHSQGRMGSPAIFSSEFLPELLALTGDQGGRVILEGREKETFYYELPPEAVRDYDVPWT